MSTPDGTVQEICLSNLKKSFIISCIALDSIKDLQTSYTCISYITYLSVRLLSFYLRVREENCSSAFGSPVVFPKFVFGDEIE